MLRMTFLLRRKEGMSRAEMQDYWLNVHGPLVMSHSATAKMLRYVQVHTTDDDHSRLPGRRGEMEEPYDGVAEVWWESRQSMLDAMQTDAGREFDRLLREDELNFADIENSSAYYCYEYPQVNPTPENIVATDRSSLVKLYFAYRHLPSLSIDEAQWYWRTHHGAVIRRQAHASGILRYQQVHADEHSFTAAVNRSRNSTVEPYTGHAEVWTDRSAMSNGIPENRAASRRAYEDEANFIDFGRSVMFLAKEHVMVDHR